MCGANASGAPMVANAAVIHGGGDRSLLWTDHGAGRRRRGKGLKECGIKIIKIDKLLRVEALLESLLWHFRAHTRFGPSCFDATRPTFKRIREDPRVILLVKF
jgi:hypothetical protein